MQCLAWFLHKRRLQILVIFLFSCAPIFTYGKLSTISTDQPQYPPSLARLDGKIQQLSPKQLIGSLTEDEQRRIAEEAKKEGFSRTVPIGAKVCAECHQDVVAQWKASAHRFSSFNNPFYEASIEDLRKQDQGKIRSRWCAGCHDPALLLTGDFDSDFDRNGGQAQAGLTCLVCHGIKDVAGRPGNGNYVMGAGLLDSGDPLLAPDGKTRIHDPEAVQRHKQNVLTDRHKSAEFCGACHKASIPAEVNNYRWFRAQNDYDPWHDSSISGNAARDFFAPVKAKNCQECHMPREKAVLGDLAAKTGRVRSHRFLAVNTALPSLRNDKDTINRIKEFLSERVSIDMVALRRGKDFINYIPLPDVTRPVLAANEEVQLDIVVRNRNVGHTFPGGTLDLNEGWLELTLIGSNGELVAINGDLQKDNTLDPEAHAYCALFLDQSNKPITRHNVADIRTLVWRHVISFGETDLVRYRFNIPKHLAGKSIILRARLLWRKFNEPFRLFAVEANPKGFPTGNPVLPIIELAKSEVSLAVSKKQNSNNAGFLSNVRPDQWDRFNYYGIGALLQRDFDTAEYAFLWVQKLAPDQVDGILNYARTMIEQGNTDEGLRLLDQIKSRIPEDPRIPWSYGQAYYMRRQYSLASSAFEAAVKLRPEDRQSWNMLGRSLADQGAYQEALKSFEKVLTIDTSNPWAHYIKGRALEELNRASEAEKAMGSYEKFRDDYSSWNRRWNYRGNNPIDNRETYPIHWHPLRFIVKQK